MNLLQLPLLLIQGIAGLRRARQVGAARDAVKGCVPHGVGETLDRYTDHPTAQLSCVRGRVSIPTGETRRAPLSQQECVWWRLRVHPRSPWWTKMIHLPLEEISHEPFYLTDGERAIRVDPGTATTHGRVWRTRYAEEHPRAFIDRKTPVTHRINARFPTIAGYMRDVWHIRRVRFTEWMIPEGAEALVTGRLVLGDEGGELTLAERSSVQEGAEPVLTLALAPAPDSSGDTLASGEAGATVTSLRGQHWKLWVGGGCLVLFCAAALLLIAVVLVTWFT